MIREIVLPFTPRPWQLPLLNDPALRIVAVVHRRAGKSTALMWRGIKRGLTIARRDPPPRIVHTLPFQVQWDRTGLWDRLERAGGTIPGARIMRSDMRLLLPNGGVYQAGGMDKPDSWRGGYADEAILDEYDDTQAAGQVTAIEPMLADFGGVLVRSGTPKGLGRLKEAYDRAGVTKGWSRYFLRWQDTGVLSAEAIEQLRAEMTPEEFAQEMECSFEAPNSGSYYGELLQAAQNEGRICHVPHDPLLPVSTSWDLGVHDATAIWFAQIARGGGWHIIDHFSDAGPGADYYANHVLGKPYTYSRHFLPHDVADNEFGLGRTRIETLKGLGLKNIVTVPSWPGAVADGINAVKMILPKCMFDEEKCRVGLKSLRGYRREWNEAMQVWRSTPRHDWASHDADGFRMLAVGAREPRGIEKRDPYSITPPRRRGSAWTA